MVSRMVRHWSRGSRGRGQPAHERAQAAIWDPAARGRLQARVRLGAGTLRADAGAGWQSTAGKSHQRCGSIRHAARGAARARDIPLGMLLVGLASVAYGPRAKLDEAIVELSVCPVEPSPAPIRLSMAATADGAAQLTWDRRCRQGQTTQSAPAADTRAADACCGGPSRRPGSWRAALPGRWWRWR